MRSKLIGHLTAGIVFVVATGAYATWPAAGDTLAPATTVGPIEKWAQIDEMLAPMPLDSLQVKRINLELSKNPEEASQQLWNLLKNSEVSKHYGQLKVPGGTSVWPIFRSRLVAAAETGGFDYSSLEMVLNSIEQQEPYLTTKGQLIPFAALLVHQAGDEVWVIPCRWESGYQPPRDGIPFMIEAGHIRAWAFLAQNGQQVGYTTCK